MNSPLPFISCVTLYHFLTKFPYQSFKENYIGDIEQLWRLNEIIFERSLVQCLISSEKSIHNSHSYYNTKSYYHYNFIIFGPTVSNDSWKENKWCEMRFWRGRDQWHSVLSHFADFSVYLRARRSYWMLPHRGVVNPQSQQGTYALRWGRQMNEAS